jgi:hypothetical protein
MRWPKHSGKRVQRFRRSSFAPLPNFKGDDATEQVAS